MRETSNFSTDLRDALSIYQGHRPRIERRRTFTPMSDQIRLGLAWDVPRIPCTTLTSHGGRLRVVSPRENLTSTGTDQDVPRNDYGGGVLVHG